MPTTKARQARNEKGYRTNLASEYYVLSTLHRLGVDASLTLGNKKSVDIVVFRQGAYPLTIDVKGVADRLDWLLGNMPTKPIANHFVVLVGYEGTINDPRTLPRAWVFPHKDLIPFVRRTSNDRTTYASRRQVIADGGAYESAWRLLTK